MSAGDIYRNDILNRNPGYSITETTQGDLVTVILYDDSDPAVEVSRRIRGNRDDAYIALRRELFLGDDVIPLLTFSQRNSLTNVPEGQNILVSTTNRVQLYNNNGWRTYVTLPFFLLHADQFEDTTASNWPVSNTAALEVDGNENDIRVRAFDDTTEEGVGFEISIPEDVESISLKIISRAKTAPVSASTVGLNLYVKNRPDNGTGSWSSANTLTDIDIPTNEFFQFDYETLDLTTLGINGGDTAKFQLTRTTPQAGTELVGDWNLLSLEIGFL